MANFILVCGQTGNGKTTGVRTLDPKNTLILRAIKRKLPFPEANKYVVREAQEYKDVVNWLEQANKTKAIKNVVITDGTYIMRHEFFRRDKEVGYNKFTDMANHMREILLAVQNCRDDMNVFMEYHVDPVLVEGNTVGYKAATVGKLLDEKYNIFENVDIILFAEPRVDGNKVTYGYYTNLTQGKGGAYLPAKTPMGMFKDIFIPNDLKLVADTINKYYGGEESNPGTDAGVGGADSQ